MFQYKKRVETIGRPKGKKKDKKTRIPFFERAWKDAGFQYIDFFYVDGYIRISDTEIDQIGSKVVLLDAYGSFRGYVISEYGEELALEFSEEMTKALIKTWQYVEYKKGGLLDEF